METNHPRLINDFAPRPSPLPKKSRYDNYPLSVRPKKPVTASTAPTVPAASHNGFRQNPRPTLIHDMAPPRQQHQPQLKTTTKKPQDVQAASATFSFPAQLRPKAPPPQYAAETNLPKQQPVAAKPLPGPHWWQVAKKNDAYLFAGTLVIALAIGAFTPINMFTQTVCLSYAVLSLLVGVDSKFSFGTALLLLIATMLSQALQYDDASSGLAVAAFLFLCAGTLTLLRESIFTKKYSS